MKFVAIIEYTNKERIAEARPSHRAYLTGLHAEGKVVASGPFEDDSGALIIYDAESAEVAEAMIAADPFHAAGVFVSWQVRPWRQVIPSA
jgi:uncharacterized protein YciI